MTFYNFISTLSPILGLVASLFFIYGILSMSCKNITDWAIRWHDENWILINSLITQKVDYLIGGSFLLFSFVLTFLTNILDKSYLVSIQLG